MPILSLDPNDPDHFRQQMGQFKGVSNTLTQLAIHIQETASEVARAANQAQGLGEDYRELHDFLLSIATGLYRSSRRCSVVSQSFDETWDLGSSLARVYKKRGDDLPVVDLRVMDITIGVPPRDDEIGDLLNE